MNYSQIHVNYVKIILVYVKVANFNINIAVAQMFTVIGDYHSLKLIDPET